MSLGQTRLCSFITRGYVLSVRQPKLVAPSAVEGHRHLTTHPQYKKPFPYKRKKFSLIRSLLEYTTARINENSRIIMIEGPPCVGKTEFAKKLAENFQLKYMSPVSEEDIFVENGLDIRELNDLMPTDRMRAYDLDMFYTEPDPKKMKYFAATQVNFFHARCRQYQQALIHLLSTGQGVVLENSAWSDLCYAQTLAEFGYFSRRGLRWYMDNRETTLNFFWKPHLIINLDAPSSMIVKNMKEKYPQYENSAVIKESYFDCYREKFRENYIPLMKPHSDVLYYDIRELEEFDLLLMDLENMDLITSRLGESKKFDDWKKRKEEEWSMYRLHLSSPKIMHHALNWRSAYDVPELCMDGEELEQLIMIREQFPQLSYHYRYWHDKDGNFIRQKEADDLNPLSLAIDDPTCHQGKPTKQIAAS